MIDAIPAAVGGVDERAVSAAPPAVAVGIGVDERIVGAVLPGTVDVLRAGHDHHVAGGRSGRAAFGIQVIVVVADLAELGTFQTEALGEPFLGIFPSGIDHLFGARHHMEPVRCQFGPLAGTEKEPPLSVFAHHVAGVDVGNSQIHGLAPRAVGGVGGHYEVHAAIGLQVASCLLAHGIRRIGHREIDIVLAVILADIRSPHGTQEGVERRADGLPMDQVAAMEDYESRHVVEGAMRHVIVLAVAHDGGVGIVASQDGIGEGGTLGFERSQCAPHGNKA